jgi:predicted TIM-barrel fold metal-dependent hydrolase
MEFPSSGSLKPLTVDEFDTTRHLAHAAKQARERGFDRFTIVDADTHHEESGSVRQMLPYIESPVGRHIARATSSEGRRPMVPRVISYEDRGGRLQRFAARKLEKTPGNVHRDITLTRRAMDAMGARLAVLYPTTCMRLSTQPKRDWEFSLALAYNRWLANDLLPQEPQLKGMLYLPLHHAPECAGMVEELGGKPGVAGCVIAAPRYEKIHSNRMARVLAAMQERGLVLAFHGVANWDEPALAGMDRWGAVQALGVPHSNMLHMANWLMGGMPERFPKLKVLWLESGIAWAHYLMQRLDNVYMKRVSEAPLLKEKPSHYMRRMYYCSQPLERPDDMGALEVAFRAINAETQLVWGSNFPSHDFDLPATIWDLPFLSEGARKAILGGNAMRLFNFSTGNGS